MNKTAIAERVVARTLIDGRMAGSGRNCCLQTDREWLELGREQLEALIDRSWDIVAVAGKAAERRLLVEAEVGAFVRAISPNGPEADGQMLSGATKKTVDRIYWTERNRRLTGSMLKRERNVTEMVIFRCSGEG